MLSAFHCRMAGHKIDRGRVWHDGLDHRTTCQRCRAPLIKRDNAWRGFDSQDADSRRKPHPHFDRA